MKRPQRTIQRSSVVTTRGRELVLIVPPTCDVILIREKGRRTKFELDIITAWHVANKLAAAKIRADRAAKRKARRAAR
jgi:hypothetical protein